MAKIVDNPKRFKVIELSRNELAKIGGIGICDRCNGTSNTGYYVAVLEEMARQEMTLLSSQPTEDK